MNLVSEAIDTYLKQHTSPENAVLQALNRETN